MILNLAVCDLCYADGKIQLASHEYSGEGKLHCCGKHLKLVRKLKLPAKEIADSNL